MRIVRTVLLSRYAVIGALAILCAIPSAAFADCARDSRGEVYCGQGRCMNDRQGVIWCSRYFEGGAERTQDGRVVCGRGQCARDIRGEIFCSTVESGPVLRDSRGRVRCYGQCERARPQHCENTLADASPS